MGSYSLEAGSTHGSYRVAKAVYPDIFSTSLSVENAKGEANNAKKLVGSGQRKRHFEVLGDIKVKVTRDGDLTKHIDTSKSSNWKSKVDSKTRVGDGCADVCNPVPSITDGSLCCCKCNKD